MRSAIILSFVFCLTLNIQAQFTEVGNLNYMNAFIVGEAQFGNGLSFCDFNGDGWDDLTIGTTSGQNVRFFENQNGTFVPTILQISVMDDSKTVLWVDFDNDGDKDFFVTNFEAQNRLFRNDGNLQFTDITTTCGLNIIDDKSYGATFGDIDNDGFLDLYIANRDNSVGGHTNLLYKNNGDGTFTDISIESQTFDGKRNSFCAAFFDADRDGYQDLYLAQDRLIGNVFYRNNGDGVFTNYSNFSGANQQMDAMNVGVGDYDNDNDLDIYVTNTPIGGNELFRNEGDFIFTEQADNAGVSFNYTGWGANFLDYDHDGYQDLYVSSQFNTASEPNLLYTNNSDGTFTALLPDGMEGDTMSSYANAVGDFDRDGDLDIIVSNNTPYFCSLWQNDLDNNHHYLQLDIEGIQSNRDGVGSWLEVFAADDIFTRYTHCGEAYLAQNSTTKHFGLGMNAQLDSLRVTWLSGAVDVIHDVIPNERIVIPEGSTSDLSDSWSMLEWDSDEYGIGIHWVPSNTQEVNAFIVQRSTDGLDYETIFEVNADFEEYQIYDDMVDWGIQYYYRVIQVRNDDRWEYSIPIIAEKTTSVPLTTLGELGVEIFPNPIRNGKIGITTNADLGLADLTLYDLLGRPLSQVHSIHLNDRFDWEIGTPIQSGVYLLSIKSPKGNVVSPITILD